MTTGCRSHYAVAAIAAALMALMGTAERITGALAADVSGHVPTVVSDRRDLTSPHPGLHSRLAGLTDELVPLTFQQLTSLIDLRRSDGTLKVRIPLSGSLQSPAWSPDGKSIVFTRFRNGYNKGPADIYIFNLETNSLRPLLADGSDNVSQPGSTWNARTGNIAFSSDRDGHEEIWIHRTDGHGRPQKVTSRPSRAAYEPSFAPDGRSLVFESREIGKDDRGQITLFVMEGEPRYIDLTTPEEDCRQPNWSPDGHHIVYQKQVGGQWDLWLHDIQSKQHRALTVGLAGDKTDVSFLPHGRFIVYSGTVPETDGSEGIVGENLLAIPLSGGRPIPLTLRAGLSRGAKLVSRRQRDRSRNISAVTGPNGRYRTDRHSSAKKRGTTTVRLSRLLGILGAGSFSP
jgi:TolB protein